MERSLKISCIVMWVTVFLLLLFYVPRNADSEEYLQTGGNSISADPVEPQVIENEPDVGGGDDVLFPSGIPTKKSYLKLLTTPYWKEVETFSNYFVRENAGALVAYKWVRDSFHWWSRQWEYPYIFHSIKKYGKTGSRIIDLGSGITFLPYLVSKTLKANVDCLDYDTTYPDIYTKLNAKMGKGVQFVNHDIRHALAYKDNSIDIVYCVSVLEHTDNYVDIVKDVFRVLKPEGFFVLSFDIAFDDESVSRIQIEKAEELVAILRSYFQEIEEESTWSSYRHVPIRKVMETKKDIITPQWFNDASLQMTHLARGEHISFTCYTFKKLKQAEDK